MLKKSEYKYRSKCLRGKARQKQRYDPNICPECGGRLRLIQGPFGKFMGCEDYPTCKFNRRVRKNRNVRVRTVLIVLYRGKN